MPRPGPVQPKVKTDRLVLYCVPGCEQRNPIRKWLPFWYPKPERPREKTEATWVPDLKLRCLAGLKCLALFLEHPLAHVCPAGPVSCEFRWGSPGEKQRSHLVGFDGAWLGLIQSQRVRGFRIVPASPCHGLALTHIPSAPLMFELFRSCHKLLSYKSMQSLGDHKAEHICINPSASFSSASQRPSQTSPRSYS